MRLARLERATVAFALGTGVLPLSRRYPHYEKHREKYFFPVPFWLVVGSFKGVDPGGFEPPTNGL